MPFDASLLSFLPHYGWYNGSGWGFDTWDLLGLKKIMPLNSMNLASFYHDKFKFEWQWTGYFWGTAVSEEFFPGKKFMPADPIGQIYHALGSIGFGAWGAIDPDDKAYRNSALQQHPFESNIKNAATIF